MKITLGLMAGAMVDRGAGLVAVALGALVPHAAAMTATRAKARILILGTVRKHIVT